MAPFFQTGPQGTTIHLPPLPSGLEAVLWLAGFGVALFVLLTVLRAAPRLWRDLNAAPDHPGGLGAWLGWSRTIDTRTATALGRVLGAGLFAVAAVTLAWLLVDFFAALARPNGHDDVRNIGLTIAALIGFPLLIWRTIVAQQQARTGQENLITGLINKAVEGLGAEKTVKEKGKEQTHPNIEVRIGAILQLERIAHTQAHSGTDQGARDHIRIMEILCAYIRENAPAAKAVDLNMGEWPDYPENPTAEELKEREQWRQTRRTELEDKIAQLRAGHGPRTDIQTALSVIGRRDATQIRIERRAIRPGRKDGYRLDLRAARLQAADLSHLDLDRANLRKARLEGAYLAETGLDGANLGEARLEGVDLREARLERTNLQWARLEGADLQWARLKRANLRKARLEGANLVWAKLERAILRQARLERANLDLASLRAANLVAARLEAADLIGAGIEGANLQWARLEGANLSGAGLEGADLRWADLRSANWAGATTNACPAWFADLRGGTDLDQPRLSSLIGNAATLLPDDPPGLYIPHKWAAEPPGLDRLLAQKSSYEFGDSDHLRAAVICKPGNVPMKTGTPWPLNAPPPWGARGAKESDDAYRRRVIAWAEARPPTEPVD